MKERFHLRIEDGEGVFSCSVDTLTEAMEQLSLHRKADRWQRVEITQGGTIRWAKSYEAERGVSREVVM